MTLPVAVQRTDGVQLRVVDLRVDRLQATADATGTATVTHPDAVESDQMWRVERIVVQSTSGKLLNLSVTDGQSIAAGQINPGLRDFGQLPKGFPQVAEYPQFLTLLASQIFTVIATGAVAGDVVTVSVQYQIVMRVRA